MYYIVFPGASIVNLPVFIKGFILQAKNLKIVGFFDLYTVPYLLPNNWKYITFLWGEVLGIPRTLEISIAFKIFQS